MPPPIKIFSYPKPVIENLYEYNSRGVKRECKNREGIKTVQQVYD